VRERCLQGLVGRPDGWCGAVRRGHDAANRTGPGGPAPDGQPRNERATLAVRRGRSSTAPSPGGALPGAANPRYYARAHRIDVARPTASPTSTAIPRGLGCARRSTPRGLDADRGVTRPRNGQARTRASWCDARRTPASLRRPDPPRRGHHHPASRDGSVPV